MKNEIKKSHKIRNSLLIGLSIILVIAAIVLGVLWNRYLNKNSLFAKFETPQAQEVYILGTLHKEHFNKLINYSMADILSVVEKVKPDVVFIEARENVYEEYGVVDGPIDMAVVYSYCLANGIQTEMIDWWVVDNNYQDNSTNDKRDDKIFENIKNKLNKFDSNTTVLVVCGSGHFYEQSKRFTANDFVRNSIQSKTTYFADNNNVFMYPANLEEIWEKRAYFYAYTQPEVIGKDENLDDEIKSQFTEDNHDGFYNQQMEYCKLFENNWLYK